MNDVNINNDPFEGPQMEAMKQASAAQEDFVKMVLRDFASPPITEMPAASEVVSSGIALVHQPSLMLMWVTQHGEQIGPKFSTAIKLAGEFNAETYLNKRYGAPTEKRDWRAESREYERSE